MAKTQSARNGRSYLILISYDSKSPLYRSIRITILPLFVQKGGAGDALSFLLKITLTNLPRNGGWKSLDFFVQFVFIYGKLCISMSAMRQEIALWLSNDGSPAWCRETDNGCAGLGQPFEAVTTLA